MFKGKKIKDLTIEEKREYNKLAQRNFIKNHPEVRLKNKKNKVDLTKADIPKEERCEGFDELWNKIYRQVIAYWDEVPERRSKYNIDNPSLHFKKHKYYIKKNEREN